MANYRENTIFSAEQFLVGSLPWPSGVREVIHPRIGIIYMLVSDGERQRIRTTDWILTDPNGTKFALTNREFSARFELVP